MLPPVRSGLKNSNFFLLGVYLKGSDAEPECLGRQEAHLEKDEFEMEMFGGFSPKFLRK
jgi:hypothetical protein